MVSAAKSAFTFHSHDHFCLVYKYQVQQRTLPCCLLDHLYPEIVMNTLQKSLWAIWVVLPKNTVVSVPEEPGPLNEVLPPVFWRQFKLYFQLQTPTPIPPMSVCPLVFTHKLLTEPWLVSKHHPIHTAALTSSATLLSLPSQPVLLKNSVSLDYSPSSRKPSHHASTILVRSQPCYCSRTCNFPFCSQANMLHKRSSPHFPKKLQDTAPHAINEHVNNQWLQQNHTRNIPFHKLLAQSETYQKRKVAQ